MTHTNTMDAPARDRQHLPALDGLRGVAILLVIIYHCHELQSGWAGVDLFFVLSGFLITGILERAKHAPSYFRNFLGRRALRILPPYLMYLTVLLVVLPLVGVLQRTPHQWWVWTYLTNVRLAATGDWQSVPPFTEHLWSVAVEEQFYLLWPLLVLRFSIPSLRRVAVSAVVIALAVRIALVLAGSNELAPYTLVFTRMDSLMIGAWLALVRFKPSRLGTAAAIIALVGFLFASVPPRNLWMMTIGYTALAAASAGLLSAILGSVMLSRIFSWAPLRAAGRYSYTAYLIHPLVIAQLREHVTPYYSRRLALLVVAVTFTISAFSWVLFEQPLLRLKRYFPEPKARFEDVRDPKIGAPSVA